MLIVYRPHSLNKLVVLLTSMRMGSSPTNKSTESVTVSRNPDAISKAKCFLLTWVSCCPLVAGRTIMHTILTSLERIAFNGDPLQFLLIQTTYQAFISFFHQTGIINEHPELKGIRSYTSLLFLKLPLLIITWFSRLFFRYCHRTQTRITT